MTVDRAALVAEFERQLAEVAERHRGRPAEELRALLLVGLERERIVTVSYRKEIVAERLSRMPVDDRVRAVVTRAVRWTWRDEERHALYVRGLLLADGSLPHRLRAWLTQVEGQVAGWAASTQHHHRWAEAPTARVAAELVELAGVAAGRIPPAARDTLHWAPFREVCAFNAAAEQTAALGWDRMAVVAPAAGARPEDQRAFRSMADDERRHASLFEILASAFDDADRMVLPGGVDALEQQIGGVGQRFLARPRPGAPAWQNPLGKGAPVACATGESLDLVLDRALVDAGLPERLDAARPADRPPRVVIKATFMHLVDRLDPSPAVSPEVLRALVGWLRARGAEVVVLEARNVYDRFLAGREVAAVARYFGIDDLPIVDATLDQRPQDFVRGLGPHSVAASWRDADLRLALGKLRSHPVTGAMLTLDALEGLGGRHDEFLFGERRAERTTATMMLLDAFPPDLAALDAWDAVPDGLLGMMACADPLRPRRLYASGDAVALDGVVASHLGVDPERAGMLAAVAWDWFGDPRPLRSVVGVDAPLPGWRAPDATELDAVLARLAEPVYHHASGHGALFVPPADDAAFPPLQPPGRALRLARAWVGSLVRLTGPPDGLPTRHLPVGGRRVRIHDAGGDGPPVVFLHGYPENLQLWGRLVRALGPGIRAVALDWPGTGDSEPWEGPTDPVSLAARLDRVLDALGLRGPITLVGADMGAQPALAWAAAHPDRAARVAVFNHLAFGDGDTSWEIGVMRRTGLASVAFRAAPRQIWDRCLRTFLPDGQPLPSALQEDLQRTFLRRETRATLARMCADYEAALPSLPALYAEVRCPVAAVWGAGDPHFPSSQAERLVATLPDARLALLADAGHWPHWTATEQVATLLRPFLEEGSWTSW